jgi:hypothetical protein
MGEEASDDITLEAIRQIVAERNGTAEGRLARSVDDLANLLDRAGDLRYEELAARVARAENGVHGEPLKELLIDRRAIALAFGAGEQPDWRFILTESYARYASAFGSAATSRVQVATLAHQPTTEAHLLRDAAPLIEMNATEIVPDALRHPAITAAAARREVLARFLALSGPTTVAEVEVRYGWDRRWIE